MRYLSAGLLALCVAAGPAIAALPKPIVTGLKSPESVVIGMDGRIYVTEIGEFDKDGDGRVSVVEGGKIIPFAEGLDDPKGIAVFQGNFFVADKKRVWKIDPKGKATIFAAEGAFPKKPLFLNDVAIDEKGAVFVSDSGDLKGKDGAIFRIDPKGKVTLVADSGSLPILQTPNGLLHDSLIHLLVVDFHSGELHRVNLETKATEKLAEGFGGGDGLIWDRFGRLFISDWKNGKVFVIAKPGAKPQLIAEGFQAAADICLDPTNQFILVPDMKAGTLTAIPAQVPDAPVDLSPLPIKAEVAFEEVTWTGWKGEENGKLVPFRPITLTHAGDGSKRIFVATQQGVIHSLSGPSAKATKVFLDITDRVRYVDKENEEGFLGLAFHPKFKSNGEFFVFYTVKTPKQTNIISRFRVSKDDPEKADPASEEELFRITRPFWNHDGGTICFGPDGFLYVALGDGGSANDPFDNGQKLDTLLGKILRIDVDRKEGDTKYAIPKDNPFVGKGSARAEIWAYGLRNPWRIAFDRASGDLWCADVGQNLWEEINLVRKGDNFGWNRREGLHPFGSKGSGPKADYVDPIWQYHHDIGKSITGGFVYRGSRLKELNGYYLYADYVSHRLWALKYDAEKKRVVENRSIVSPAVPVLSYGEDETGEVYFMTFSATGKGIYRFTK